MVTKEIRLANEPDLPELVGLLNELFTQDIEFEPDYATQESGLRKIIGNHEVGDILVLVIDGKIIGMVSLLYSISTARQRLRNWKSRWHNWRNRWLLLKVLPI